jgi:alkylation response protein AidB-like acyl-CoA dehydrogenase
MRFTAADIFGVPRAGAGVTASGVAANDVAANIAKLLWAPWHQRLGELAVDVAGADATLAGQNYDLSDAQRLFLYTRADTIYGGSNEVQRNIVAERGLGLPKG